MADNVEFGMNMNFGDSFKNLSELKKKISEVEDALRKTSDPKIVEGLSNALNKLTGDLNKFKNEMISTITIMKNADKQVFSNIGKGLSSGFNIAIQSVNTMNSSTQQLVTSLKQAQGAAAFKQVGNAVAQNTATNTASTPQGPSPVSIPQGTPKTGTTDYELLTKAAKELDNQVNSLRLAMMALEEQGQQTTSQYSNLRVQLEQLAPEAASLRGKLSSVQMATAQGTVVMDKYAKATGQGSKNNKTFAYETNSMQQVLRELPSFAYGAQTGLMALSNNLPILADNFKAMAQATDNATGKSVGFKGAFIEMAKSIVSPIGLISLGITAITALGPAIYDYIMNTEDAEKAEKKAAEQKKRLIEIEKQRIAQLKSIAGIINNEKLAIMSLARQIEMSIPSSERRNELIAEYNKLSYIAIKNTKDEAKFQKELAYIEKKNIEWITHRIGIKINESYLEKLMTEQYITNTKLKEDAEKAAWLKSKKRKTEQARLDLAQAQEEFNIYMEAQSAKGIVITDTNDPEYKRLMGSIDSLNAKYKSLYEQIDSPAIRKMGEDFDYNTKKSAENLKEQERVYKVIGGLSRLIPASPSFITNSKKDSEEAADNWTSLKEAQTKLDSDFATKEYKNASKLNADLDKLEELRLKVIGSQLQKELLLVEEKYDDQIKAAEENYDKEVELLFDMYKEEQAVIDMTKQSEEEFATWRKNQETGLNAELAQAKTDQQKDAINERYKLASEEQDRLRNLELNKRVKSTFTTNFMPNNPQAILAAEILAKSIVSITVKMQEEMSRVAGEQVKARIAQEKKYRDYLKNISSKESDNIFKSIMESYKLDLDDYIDLAMFRVHKSFQQNVKLLSKTDTSELDKQILAEKKILEGKTLNIEYQTEINKKLVEKGKISQENLDITIGEIKNERIEREKAISILEKTRDEQLKKTKDYIIQCEKMFSATLKQSTKLEQSVQNTAGGTANIVPKTPVQPTIDSMIKKYDKQLAYLRTVLENSKKKDREEAGKLYSDIERKLQYAKQIKKIYDTLNLDRLKKMPAIIGEGDVKRIEELRKLLEDPLEIPNYDKYSLELSKLEGKYVSIADVIEESAMKEMALDAEKLEEYKKNNEEKWKIYLKYKEFYDKDKKEGITIADPTGVQPTTGQPTTGQPTIKKLPVDPESIVKFVKDFNANVTDSKDKINLLPLLKGSLDTKDLTPEEIAKVVKYIGEEFDKELSNLDLNYDKLYGDVKNPKKLKDVYKANEQLKDIEWQQQEDIFQLKKKYGLITEKDQLEHDVKEIEHMEEQRQKRRAIVIGITDDIFKIAQSTLDVVSAMANSSMNLMNERMALQEQLTQNSLDNYDREIAKLNEMMDTQKMSDSERINSTQKVIDLENERALVEKNQKIASLEMQKRQIEISKKMALAQAAIAGGIALANVVAIATEGALGTGPGAPFVFAASLAAGIAAVGTQVFAAKSAIESADYQTQTIDAQIAGIENAYQSGMANASSSISGGGGAGPAAPLTTFNKDLVNQGQSNANYNLDGGLQGYKIYVTQADIQNANNQVKKITKKVTFG